MNTSGTSGKAWIAGLITAVAASLCCITPVLALIAGSAGIASAFSWLAPARPYLIGITVAVLGFAWYQKLKPKKQAADCACEEGKSSFWKSKAFLGIMTILALLLLAFPGYSSIFFPKPQKKEIVVVDKSNIRQVTLKIRGMDCEACSQTINHVLSLTSGVLSYQTSYKDSGSIVKFDNSKTSQKAIVDAVNKTGYTVANITRDK